MQVKQARWGLVSVEGKVKWKEETQGLVKLAENKTWWSNKIIAVALLQPIHAFAWQSPTATAIIHVWHIFPSSNTNTPCPVESSLGKREIVLWSFFILYLDCTPSKAAEMETANQLAFIITPNHYLTMLFQTP